MLGQIIFLFVAFTLLIQSAPLKQELQPTTYEDVEAYAVYAVILQAYSSTPQRKNLVIRSQTSAYKMCLEPDKESAAIIGSAIAAYIKQNEKPHLLLRAFDNKIQYELLTADELKSIFVQGHKEDDIGGWRYFSEKYPNSGGYIELSAVGFNEDKSVAVVYMGHHCGGLCGEGQFHVLQKKAGTWQPLEWKGNQCSWIS